MKIFYFSFQSKAPNLIKEYVDNYGAACITSATCTPASALLYCISGTCLCDVYGNYYDIVQKTCGK